jgi:hypothetical protein
MASAAEAPAQALVTDEDLALAEQQFQDGVEAFDEDDFDTASDLLAQAVEIKVAKYGEHNARVVPAYVKYAAALLGCARSQDDNVLGALKVRTAPWRTPLHAHSPRNYRGLVGQIAQEQFLEDTHTYDLEHMPIFRLAGTKGRSVHWWLCQHRAQTDDVPYHGCELRISILHINWTRLCC